MRCEAVDFGLRLIAGPFLRFTHAFLNSLIIVLWIDLYVPSCLDMPMGLGGCACGCPFLRPDGFPEVNHHANDELD